NGFERRRIPELQRIGRLHIVMPIDQNRATLGLMFVACPNDGMPARGNKLCLQTNTGEFFHQPLCALLQFLLVLIVRRDTRKAQKGRYINTTATFERTASFSNVPLIDSKKASVA